MKSKALVLAAIAAVTCVAANASPPSGAKSASNPSSASVHVLQIVGTDYAYQAPDSVPAGRTEIRFRNVGKQNHEIAVVLARKGTTAMQISAAATAGVPAPRLGEAYASGSPFGALFAAPGETSSAVLVTNLQRGQTYVIVCTLRDAAAMPQHAAMGMFHVLHVM